MKLGRNGGASALSNGKKIPVSHKRILEGKAWSKGKKPETSGGEGKTYKGGSQEGKKQHGSKNIPRRRWEKREAAGTGRVSMQKGDWGGAPKAAVAKEALSITRQRSLQHREKEDRGRQGGKGGGVCESAATQG